VHRRANRKFHPHPGIIFAAEIRFSRESIEPLIRVEFAILSRQRTQTIQHFCTDAAKRVCRIDGHRTTFQSTLWLPRLNRSATRKKEAAIGAHQGNLSMRYLHTMVRIRDIEQSLKFYRDGLELVEVRRIEHEKGRFTLIFLAAPEDQDRARTDKTPMLELTYNWDREDYGSARNFGHLAFLVDDIYATCERLRDLGVTINRPPRDGHMAFVRSPDLISIELLQRGEALPLKEPWASLPNTGTW
jgi:lactoylglutathione lyase